MFFGEENGPKLVPKCDPKLISTLKAENQLKASRLAFSWLSGVEVGSKSRLKIDHKRRSTWESILASIFIDFGGFLEPSWEVKSSQDIQKWHRQNDEKMKRNKMTKKAQ